MGRMNEIGHFRKTSVIAKVAIIVSISSCVLGCATPKEKLAAGLKTEDNIAIKNALESGADINKPASGSQDLPLNEAVKKGNLGMAKFLIEMGADVNSNRYRSKRPLQVASMKADFSMVKLLLEKGAKVSGRDNVGGTALHSAVLGRSRVRGSKNLRAPSLEAKWKVIDLLLDNGANVKATGNLGFTPMHFVVEVGDIESAKRLIAHGAEVDVKSNLLQTPLHRACCVKMAKFLLEHGADINAQNGDGETALHRALERQKVKLAQFFIDSGANLSVKDVWGYSAEDIIVPGGWSDRFAAKFGRRPSKGWTINVKGPKGKKCIGSGC